MTLQVPFEDLETTMKRFGIEEAYLRSENGVTVITAYSQTKGAVLYCQTATEPGQIKSRLEAASLKTYSGIWSQEPVCVDTTPQEDCQLFVAAVSYQSGEHVPGVWVDAYTDKPNHVQVLQALYEEFVHTGEMPNVTIEQFILNAKPNVIVVSDSELRGYRDAKLAPPQTSR